MIQVQERMEVYTVLVLSMVLVHVRLTVGIAIDSTVRRFGFLLPVKVQVQYEYRTQYVRMYRVLGTWYWVLGTGY